MAVFAEPKDDLLSSAIRNVDSQPDAAGHHPIRIAAIRVGRYALVLPATLSGSLLWGKRTAAVFDPSLLIQLALQRAADRAGKASIIEQRTISKKEIAKALNVLERANEAGELDSEIKASLEPLAAFQEEQRAPELVGQPIRLTPLYEILSEKDGLRLVRGPYGVGGRPTGQHIHGSFDRPSRLMQNPVNDPATRLS